MVAKSLGLCEGEPDLGDFADSCARVDHRDIFESEKDLEIVEEYSELLDRIKAFIADA